MKSHTNFLAFKGEKFNKILENLSNFHFHLKTEQKLLKFTKIIILTHMTQKRIENDFEAF